MGSDHAAAAERRALGAYVKLMRAAESVTAHLSIGLREVRLTTSQIGVLEALYHLGPMCQGDLSAKLLKSNANLTVVVGNLERRGLVSRCPDPEDRRRVIVTLTANGHRLISKVFPAHAARITRRFSVLDTSEQELLAALCRRLGLGDERR
ncbi:MAG: MarR family transcriptional regulator [Acidobacteria bacterium]|nr:MarR family transcriptional regulator [Acidobacteriota bacterium]